MSVTDKKLKPFVPSARVAGVGYDGAASLDPIVLGVSSVAASQAAAQQDAKYIPYPFEIVRIDAYAKSVIGAASVDVQIGGVSVLTGQITPGTGANPPANGTLVTSRIACRGAAGTTIVMLATTAAASSLGDVDVTVWVRPYPQNGEA